MYQDKIQNYGAYGNPLGQQTMANAPEAALRQREIPEQLAQLAKAQEFLGHSLNELESRLSPVLRSNPPSPTDAKQLSAAPPCTGHGAELYERVQFTTHAAERIQDFMRRLEI